jgi:hypothetical protein
MRAFSFDKEALNITIRNLHPGLELISPVYCGDGAVCYAFPDQQTGIDNITEASFGITSKKENFKGLLLYKLERKHTTKTDNQLNSDTASIEDTAPKIYLLLAWDLGHPLHKSPVCLIECTDDFTWDEDSLWALYRDYNDEFYMKYESDIITWATNSGTVIKTKRGIVYEPDHELDVVLSEGIEKYNIEKPMKIDPKRSVFSFPISIVLIYAVRLNIRPSIKLNIYNKCLDVDLVSPTYITRSWLDCHKPLNYKVCADNTMRAGFTIYNPGNEPSGALIYRLQRKKSHESTKIDKSISSAAHLLVVWEISRSKGLHADALLVEHDRGFNWSEVDLKDLYRKNFNRFRWFPYSVTEAWSLDDNTALTTTSEFMNGDRILNIIISEVETGNGTRTPAHIKLEG